LLSVPEKDKIVLEQSGRFRRHAFWRRFGRAMALSALLAAGASAELAQAETPEWTLTLHASDFLIGPPLARLGVHRSWRSSFDDHIGTFEIALRKTAAPAPVVGCPADFLVLTMPNYYPENPRQAPLAERKAVYDRLLAIQASGRGEFVARVMPASPGRQRASGPKWTGCTLAFVLPLDWVAPEAAGSSVSSAGAPQEAIDMEKMIPPGAWVSAILPDGTLNVLIPPPPGTAIGLAVRQVRPVDPGYEAVLRHFGLLTPDAQPVAPKTR
jgi:hypothetical protein